MQTSGEDCGEGKRPRESTSSASDVDSFIKAVNFPGVEARPTHPALLIPVHLQRPGLPWECVLSLPAAAIVLGALPSTPTPDVRLAEFTEWLRQSTTQPGLKAQLDEDAAAPAANVSSEDTEGFEAARRCLRGLDHKLRWAAPDRWLVRRVAPALHHLDLHSAGWHITGLGEITQWLSDVTTIPSLRNDVAPAIECFPTPPGILDDVHLDVSCRRGLLPYGRVLIARERSSTGLLEPWEDRRLGDAAWGIWRRFNLAEGTHDKCCEKTMGMSRWPNTLFPACTPAGPPAPVMFNRREFMFTGSLPFQLFKDARFLLRLAGMVECAWERVPLDFVQRICSTETSEYTDFIEECNNLQDTGLAGYCMDNVLAKFGPLVDRRRVGDRLAYQAPQGGDVRVGVVQTVGHLLKDCLGKGRDTSEVGNIVLAASGGLGKTRVAEDLRRAALMHRHRGHPEAAAPDLQVVCEAWDAVLKENHLEHVVVLSISMNNGTVLDPKVEHCAMQSITWRAGLDAAHQSRPPIEDTAWLEPPRLCGSQDQAFKSVGKTQLGDVVGAARRSASPDAPRKVLVVLAVDDFLKFEAEGDRREVLEGLAELQYQDLCNGVPTVCFVTALDIEPVANVWVNESQRALIAVRLPPLALKASVALLRDMLGLVELSLHAACAARRRGHL